jgi:hypothetical protein
MKYIIDGIEFDLSRPINKFWYSKFKKLMLKNEIEYIQRILEDTRDKNKIKYSPFYYACVKFIKYTTNIKFKKQQNNLYWITTFNDDFMDTFIVDCKNNFKCSRTTNNLEISEKTLLCGKNIGKCKNRCCQFYCKKKKILYSMDIKN